MKTKTKESTRKAIDKYNAKFERQTINLKPGTKEKVRNYGYSVNGLICELLYNWLEEQEKKTK